MDFLEKVLINYYKPKFNIIHKDRNDLTTKLININLNWQFYTKITAWLSKISKFKNNKIFDIILLKIRKGNKKNDKQQQN